MPHTPSNRTLLVGYDGSKQSDAALSAALNSAESTDMVTVIHAYRPVPSWLGSPFYDRHVRDVQYDARQVLARAGEAAAESPAEVSLEMHEGSPADVLARIGALRDVDEIFVGSRGIGRLQAAVRSVSQQLMRTADRPVVVVPSRTPSPTAPVLASQLYTGRS